VGLLYVPAVRRPTHATVVAYLSLFVALGGTSVAAVQLTKNSVKSKQIKNGQVKTADLGRGAVTSAKVRDRSLLSNDFAAGQLPQGATGAQGPRGDRGPAGENFTAGSTLKSGEVLSGPYAVSQSAAPGAGSQFLSDAIQFAPPMAADLCTTSDICAEYVTSSSSPACPGVGQRSPTARLCYYEADRSGSIGTYSCSCDPRSQLSAVRRYGTILFFNAGTTGGYVRGTWTLTAP
jgi:hypothetical protein